MTDEEPSSHKRRNHGPACVCWHPGIPGDPGAPAKMQRAGVKPGEWPYGPNIDLPARAALLEWTEATGYRLAGPRARRCLHWVVGQARRCSALQDVSHFGVLHGNLGRYLDHPTLWTREGKPALLLAQPYAAPPEEWTTKIEQEWPVDIRITPKSPWYGFDTVGVFVTPR